MLGLDKLIPSIIIIINLLYFTFETDIWISGNITYYLRISSSLCFDECFPFYEGDGYSHATNRTLTPTTDNLRSVWIVHTGQSHSSKNILESWKAQRFAAEAKSFFREFNSIISKWGMAWICCRSSYLFADFFFSSALPNRNTNIYDLYGRHIADESEKLVKWTLQRPLSLRPTRNGTNELA